MGASDRSSGRRSFIGVGVAATGAAAGALLLGGREAAALTEASEINLIGPKAGYSPQIGTLVSMMTWMRAAVLRSVKGMTQADLDYLLDAKANTIGAMLLHLGATETYYGIHTFENKEWGTWPEVVKKQWDAASQLGDAGRKEIKGKPLEHYLALLHETREHTLSELRKRDDDWLMAVDKSWPWGPTNNHCKWFHVCEHESNHNGQIKFVRSRLPGAKSKRD